MSYCSQCGVALLPSSPSCPACGSDDAAPSAPLVMDGRYVVESVLGRGGMGIVYLARDMGLDRPVALKVVAPEILALEGMLDRFRREARALAAIRHPNVVQVYTFGRHADSYFIAMEYVPGKTLSQILELYLANGAVLPLQLVITILESLAAGLDAVHAAGLVHRDVKPANVVIEERTGRAVLLDLGLAKRVLPAGSGETQLVGSPSYMAPEQIRESPGGLTPATDLYALACTSFELMTGRPPFVGRTPYETMNQHLTKPVPPVSSVRTDVPGLDGVIATAMAKDPAARFPSCGAFAEALHAAAGRFRSASETMAVISAPPPGSGSLRLLVVDDDHGIRGAVARAARRAFPELDLDIRFAESGEQALESARVTPPDLISLDYDMPGMNGVEALGLLRAQRGVELTPTIVLTGHPEERIRWRFELLGVVDYVTKPFEMETIVRVMRRAVGGRRAAMSGSLGQDQRRTP